MPCCHTSDRDKVGLGSFILIDHCGVSKLSPFTLTPRAVRTPKRAEWEMKNCKSLHAVIFFLQFKAHPVSVTPGNSLLPVCSMLPTPAGVSTRTIIRLHSYTICLTREHVFFQHARFPWSIRTEMQHMWNRSIIHILTALQVDLELWLWFPCRGCAGHLK